MKPLAFIFNLRPTYTSQKAQAIVHTIYTEKIIANVNGTNQWTFNASNGFQNICAKRFFDFFNVTANSVK